MRLMAPVLMTVLATTSMAASAKYNGENRGKPVMPAQSNAKWATKCAACHMAYPPGLLPAASWRKVMTGLGQHFGTDASLPAAEAKEITDYLVKYAAIRWTSSAADKGNFDEKSIKIPQ